MLQKWILCFTVVLHYNINNLFKEFLLLFYNKMIKYNSKIVHINYGIIFGSALYLILEDIYYYYYNKRLIKKNIPLKNYINYGALIGGFIGYINSDL